MTADLTGTTAERTGTDEPSTGRAGDALAPVRHAVLGDADAEATAIVARARAAADDTVAAAQQEVDEAVAAARRRAAAAAAARARGALDRARRDHHTEILRAEAVLHDELAARVRYAVAQLPDDPRWPTLLDRLEQLARDQLGEDAVTRRDPEPGRGVVAEAGGRRVDYGLDALATRAFAAIEHEVAESWS